MMLGSPGPGVVNVVVGLVEQRDLGNVFADALAAAAQIPDSSQPQSLREGAPRPEPEARIVPRG